MGEAPGRRAVAETNPSNQELQGVVLPVRDDRVHSHAADGQHAAAPSPPRTRDPLARAHPGRQALLVVAHLRTGGTYAELACGFKVGTSTVYRYVREAIDLLAAMAPTLDHAMQIAARKAFVIIDGTLLRIDRVGMAPGYDRAFYSGRHKAHGLNVQVIGDPVGRLVWISPPLPGARHDMGAAHQHGITDALTK